MVVGYGNHYGVFPIHENSDSGMATNPTAAQGLSVKSKRPLTKGSRCNWSPVWKGWLIHRCLLSAVFGVKGMTKEDVPRRPAAWIHAKNLHLLVLLMGERANITCYAKCTAQRELVRKQFILPWGKKNIIAIIIYEELINTFERFLYFPGYDCKAKNILSDFFPPSPYLQILPNGDFPFHKKEPSIKREFEKNFNCSN